ncbi:sugar ABC transporter ATP-binding protein [Streptomyces yaizuensis]|uniref:Sugar ABC transporter ATP-binding protein n=1 Tax=Streptomyces yaizuensis TaxID=2989713 RepID=A0ABQ5P148_9ACTN|nr:sugar ABC transporter ATP-binding protein [Streptomyces sp. YSPA8]GLF96234.1 sugar ABC transporter ATP-binding protein [Streptomyces sp. YSPA8]
MTAPASRDPVPQDTGPPALRARGIVKRFGPTLALDRVDLTVAPGEAHALVGRNGAGKSTLVGVVTGLHRPDAGTVALAGRPAPAHGDAAAWRARVACVHQRPMTVPGLTVAENLFLGRFEPGRPLIGWRRLRRRAAELLGAYGVDVDPRTRVGDLTVEQRQFVEIARALSFGARLIVLDEPTARLDARGGARLFARLRELGSQGVAFLFISHHLPEVYELCATVTVYRDARHVLTAPVADLSRTELVAAMTGDGGRPAPRPPAPATAPAAGERAPLLRTEGLALTGVYGPLDLAVRPGEVLGLAGAAAAGAVAVGETLAGMRAPTAGRITVDGRAVRPGRVPDALDAGIGYVPEERHRQGLVPGRSVAENATLTVAGRLGPFGIVLPARARALAQTMITALDIRTGGPGQSVAELSGGNQQKVVVARALARGPRVLVAVAPTAGVDITSKKSLLGVVRRFADEGGAVVLVSGELDDLRICDRVLALFHGRPAARFGTGWSDRELVAAMEGTTVGTATVPEAPTEAPTAVPEAPTSVPPEPTPGSGP